MGITDVIERDIRKIGGELGESTQSEQAKEAVDLDASAYSQGPLIPKGKISKARTSVVNKNFFARWFKTTKFHQRWCALPMFEEDIVAGGCFPIIQETNSQSALKTLQKHVGPRSGSVWDMFTRIYTKMYMEIMAVPAPPAVAVQKNTGKIIGPKITNAKNQFRGIAAYFVKPQCLFSITPMCNVLFPSMINSFSYQENYLAQPTRVQIKGFGHGSKLAKFLTTGMDAANASIIKQILNTGHPNVVYERAKMSMKAPGSNDSNYLLFPEELFKGPVILRMNAPPWMQQLQSQVNSQKTAFAQAYEALSEGSVYSIQPNENESDVDFQKRVIREARDKQAELDTESKSEYVNKAVSNENKTEEQAETAWDKSVSKRSDPKNISSLMRKYAEYEFLRARYEQRSCNISAMWNPYVVPGFPLVVIDQRASGYDCVGYLTAVAQNFSVRSEGASVGTQLNTNFVRTLQEDSRDKIAEPLSSVRKVFQNATNAAGFFKSVFFKKVDPGKPIIFEMDKVLETTNKKYKVLGPTKEYADAFENYGTAMNLVSRPGCTLREYIEAYHGKDLDTLISEGVVQGENRSFYSSARDSMPDKKTSGAVYWSRIYKLKQGSGPNPGVKITNVNDDATGSPGTSGFTAVDHEKGNMPQTRYDWDTTLELYRTILLGKGIGSVPQE